MGRFQTIGTMRYLARSALLLSLFAGVVMIVDCGGDDEPPATPSSSADGSYSGAMIGNGFSAAIKLTIPTSGTSTQTLRPRAIGPVTLTGTIDAAALGVPVTITGTYDPATQSVSFQGSSPKGEISFRGRYADGTIAGDPATTPFGPVPLVLVKDLLGVHVYCGEVTGAVTGAIGVFTAGNRAGVAFSAGGNQGALLGSFNGTAVDIQNGSSKVLGNVSGATLTGTVTPAGSTNAGSFTASEGRCASVAAAILDGGTDGSIPDGSPPGDSGPPKTPEVVTTAPAPGVGHITLSGSTLYYSVAYTYFSQKVEIRKVGTNGQGDTVVLAANTPQQDGGDARKVVSGLAVSGNNLYLAGGTNPPGGDSQLFSVPTSGGTLTPYGSMGAAAQFENYNNLVADNAGVYHAECQVVSSVYGVSLAGVAGGAISGLIGTCAIATDGTNVFFGGGETTGIRRVANTIATTSPAPATTEVAAADTYKIGNFFPSMQSMTLDATHVYWAAADNAGKKGGIWRRAKDGSGTTQSVAQLPKLHRGAIAVDDTFVYFFMVDSAGQGPSSATLNRVAKTTTNGTPEAIGSANPYSVVSDGSFVYYGDGVNLRKVAK